MVEYDEEFRQAASALMQAGRFSYDRGWVPATSGNFSARLPGGHMAITVSGVHKGHLTEQQIMVADLEGNSLDGKRPSAETQLHVLIYRLFQGVGSVLHTHSVAATLLSRQRSGELRLQEYEILKAFEGIDTHTTEVAVPIFPNDQNIPRLAVKVEEYLVVRPQTKGFLIAGHGLYTWGSSVADTVRHLEAFEFLFDCELTMQGVSRT